MWVKQCHVYHPWLEMVGIPAIKMVIWETVDDCFNHPGFLVFFYCEHQSWLLTVLGSFIYLAMSLWLGLPHHNGSQRDFEGFQTKNLPPSNIPGKICSEHHSRANQSFDSCLLMFVLSVDHQISALRACLTNPPHARGKVECVEGGLKLSFNTGRITTLEGQAGTGRGSDMKKSKT